MKKEIISTNLYEDIKKILTEARNNVYKTVNFVMVEAYWNIGRRIVEEEQKGKKKADYGTKLISGLSIGLSRNFGKGFDDRNLFYMRQFYLTFPKLNALRSELSWTHYRLLLRVDKEFL